MIIVVATIELHEGHRARFLAEFHRIVPAVRAENGCIEYGPTVDAATDIEMQHRNSNEVTIVEKWESVDALKAHLVAPHMIEYRPKVSNMVASSKLQILEPA